SYAESAAKILGSEKEACLGVRERPMAGERRQNRAEKRGNDTDQDETQMEQETFAARTGLRRSGGRRGHAKGSLSQDAGRNKRAKMAKKAGIGQDSGLPRLRYLCFLNVGLILFLGWERKMK